MATQISAYLDSVRSDKYFLFSQNGKEYIVMIEILLPHEAVKFLLVTAVKLLTEKKQIFANPSFF